MDPAGSNRRNERCAKIEIARKYGLVAMRTASSGRFPQTSLRLSLALVLAFTAAGCMQSSDSQGRSGAGSPTPTAVYKAEINAWRAGRDADLRNPDGWLTLAGLFWLRPGANTAGSATGNDLVFPEGAPAKIGTFTLTGGMVRFEAEPSAEITQAGKRAGTVILDPIASDGAALETGSFRFHAIERAGQIGIRLRDHESSALAAFTGMENFPVQPAWRVKARFETFDKPLSIKVPNIVGTAFDELVYGKLVFDFDGKPYQLEPLYKPEEGFFVIFADETNGHETYGGGRFLATEPPAPDGTVILDFNKSYNPPCVFNNYATCPLPPSGNRMAVRIEAGEKMYRAGPAGEH